MKLTERYRQATMREQNVIYLKAGACQGLYGDKSYPDKTLSPAMYLVMIPSVSFKKMLYLVNMIQPIIWKRQYSFTYAGVVTENSFL